MFLGDSSDELHEQQTTCLGKKWCLRFVVFVTFRCVSGKEEFRAKRHSIPELISLSDTKVHTQRPSKYGHVCPDLIRGNKIFNLKTHRFRNWGEQGNLFWRLPPSAFFCPDGNMIKNDITDRGYWREQKRTTNRLPAVAPIGRNNFEEKNGLPDLVNNVHWDTIFGID